MTRSAIVTGAARGIGAGIARRLAGEGWKVTCADQDGEAVASLASEICGSGVTCDVGSETDIERLVALTRARWGRIDAIVSNAGMTAFAPIQQTSRESWDRVLATNLTATFLLARAAESDLRRARGAIRAIASARAPMSGTNTLGYSATKGGLVALTHALAITLAPDVRVNCISPGWIATGKQGALTASDHAQHPAGRVGRPEDIASAVSYFLSADASFVTGAELVVDGGMTRKMIYT